MDDDWKLHVERVSTDCHPPTPMRPIVRMTKEQLREVYPDPPESVRELVDTEDWRIGMSEHSPGPWKWEQDEVSKAWRLLDANGRAVFWPVPDPRATAPGGMRTTDINCPRAGDARLIADAPEMARLLGLFADHEFRVSCSDEWFKEFKAKALELARKHGTCL